MRRDRRSSVLKRTGGLVLFQEKETIGLLFCFGVLREGKNWCTTVLRRRKLLFDCFEENWSTTVLMRREPLVYFFEKNWWTTVSGGENHWSTVLKRTGAMCTTVFRRRKPSV